MRPIRSAITLTLGRLQELITRAVQEVTELLEARIQILEEARRIEREKKREASQDGQKGLDQIFKMVQDLQAENRALKANFRGFPGIRCQGESL